MRLCLCVGQRIGYYGTLEESVPSAVLNLIRFQFQNILPSQFISNLANYQWAQGQPHVQAITTLALKASHALIISMHNLQGFGKLITTTGP